MALITGTSRADKLSGKSQADTIYGGGAGDLIEDFGPRNLIYGDLYADAPQDRHDGGNDTIRAGSINVVHAGGGDDQVDSGTYSTLYGGAGNDTLQSGGSSRIYAGSGDDVVQTYDDSTVYGGAGRDHLTLEGSGGVVYGGLGHDLILATGTVYTDDGDAATPAQGGDRVVVPADVLYSWGGEACAVQDFKPGAGGDVLSLARLLPQLDRLGYEGFNPLLDRARLATDGTRVVQSGAGMLGGDSWLRLQEAEGAVQVQLDASGHGGYRTVALLRGVSLAQLTAANFDPPFDFDGAAAAGRTVHLGNAADWLLLLEGDDSVRAGSGDDVVYTLGGNDRIDGGAGNDQLRGGAGDDFLVGGDGNDLLMGGRGQDTLLGGPGRDSLYGSGNDTLRGQQDDDTLVIQDDIPLGSSPGVALPLRAALLDGGQGADRLSIDFAAGRSTLLGGAGNDTLSVGFVIGGGAGGGSGDPALLDGGAGDDLISMTSCHFATALGGEGNDTLLGIGDGLVIKAGPGDDHIRVMSGQLEANRITTGAGADVVELASWVSPYAGPTIVTDFKPGAGGDRLDLHALYFLPALPNVGDPFAAGLLRLTPSAHGTRVELDADGGTNGTDFRTALLLQGVAPESLTADNFVQPVQPLLSGNAAVPRAQANKTIVLEAGAAPVALGLSAPVDPDGGTVSITMGGRPYPGRLLLDGQALHPGSLTVDELTRLQFEPGANAHGKLGGFTYFVTDDEGSTIARSVSFEANPADGPALLQPLGALQGSSGGADLFSL